MLLPSFSRRTDRPAFSPRCAAALTLLTVLLPIGIRADNHDAAQHTLGPRTAGKQQIASAQPKHSPSETSKPGVYSGDDTLANVEGEPITRRAFTAFWLRVDTQANRPLGMILLNEVRGKTSLVPAYTIREADIYQALYSGPTEAWATFLSNLVTNRLVAHEAARRHVVVTQAEAEAAGRALLKQAREQQGLKLSDAQILKQFRVPRDLFLQEMTFRLRGERLYADSLARRNGHPLNADDWIVLRSLFAGANIGTDARKNAQENEEARRRVASWADEVKAGKPFADVAAARNEDETRAQGGLRGPALRGTGTPDVENAVFGLKPGQISTPLRGKDGWYVFLVERRGAQIPAKERASSWQQVLDKRLTPYLADLRHHAKITSAIPLPSDTLTATDPSIPPVGK